MRNLWWAGTLLAFAGCAPSTKVTGTENAGDPTTPAPRTQSETRITVATFGVTRNTVVAYNNETESVENGTIVHSPSGRQVFPGASEAGYSWSSNDGTTWNYGGTIPTIPGWPVIWSDPGATTSRVDGHYVFLSYLAVPAAKFPYAVGYIQDAINDYIGGACIMRSVDGGQTFSVYQCVQATDFNAAGDFYDGTSMAAGDDGAIYFVTNDVNTNAAHVWRAADANSPFMRITPDPFLGSPIVEHPQVRTANSEPYVLAPTQSDVGGAFSLLISRFHDGGWTAPVTVTNNAAVGLNISFSGGFGRRGEEYSFDIGAADAFADDEVRVSVTAPPAPFARINTSVCTRALTSCKAAPGWGSPSGAVGDIFSPTLKFFDGNFSATGPIWKLAYLSRAGDPSGNTYSVDEGNMILIGTAPTFIPLTQVSGLPVCASTLTDYFGDYDDLGLIGLESDFRARFIRAYTDSSLGCSIRDPFSAWNQHVSAAVFP